jgi:trehalose 6-phosphate phosphatase
MPPLATLLPPLLPPPAITSDHSVLLDFDGTLVDIVDRPDAVVVDVALTVLLQRLNGTLDGRLALVSGRSVAQLSAFLGHALDNLAFIGSHGAEVRAGSRQMSPTRPTALIWAEREIRAAFADRAEIIVEVKSLGVAVHYRLAPGFEPAVHALINRIATETGLAVQEGKMMIELLAGGHDKGTGITALMAEPPFAGTVPVFAGDDLTDEAGFVAVAKLNGIGVLVGPERPTAARYRLPDVASVRAWLEQAA